MTANDKDLKAFEAVAHEVATEDAANAQLTPELRREARVLVDYARDRIAEMRREERQHAAGPASAAVRPSILAMARDAIMARLGELCAAHPQMVLAHRDFAELSDDDLRSALEDAEATLERAE